MIAVIDYDTGNLRSVAEALSRAGGEFIITSDHDEIRRAGHVILPGVGEASSAMEKLRTRGLDRIIPELTVPVLGICIGMQLMCLSSEEGNAECMGIFPAKVKLLPKDVDGEKLKVPHMGWDSISGLNSPIFNGIEENEWVYYVHSFAAELCRATSAVSHYGIPFSGALSEGNFHGVQFHPEKSGSTGARIIDNFLKL